MTRTIEIIFGKTGSGKSTFVRAKLLSQYKRLIIIDAMREYNDGLIFTSFEDMIDYIKENDIFDLEEFTLICRFTSDKEIDYTFQLCEAMQNVCLILEEAEIYISPFTKSSQFIRLINYGRHFEVSIIAVARRTAELSNTLRAQVNTIYSFIQTDSNDLEKMKKLGFNDLEKLQSYEYPNEHVEGVHYKKIDY